MFPGQIVRGHVDSLAPASGQEFALLPPDNATGNFTKVVQRIPVKIALDDGSNSPSALRPGMSVIPTIETRNPAPTRQVRGGSEASGASKAAGVPQAAGASKISNNVSANTSVNGACHVQSHPVSLDRSASDLFDRI
jgi:membrane fusion protein (multidrug efflux system)